MPEVELSGGHRASYEVIGTGAPMMMFPGGPGLTGAYLRPTADLLSDRFESFLLDPPGSGASTPPSDAAGYDHLGHARFYEEVRAALGLERVSVLGHSFGATVALTYAALFPDHVLSCISVDGLTLGGESQGPEAAEVEAAMQAGLDRHRDAPWYPEAIAVMNDWTDRVLAATDGREIDRMMATVQPLYFAHPDRPDVKERLEEWTKNMRFDLAAVQAWEGGLWQTIDLRPLLPQITCPLLVIAGVDDFICGPEQAKLIAREAPGADLLVIPDCGHNPDLEAPDELKRGIFDWWDQQAFSVS
jgi:proline iminopeptidase